MSFTILLASYRLISTHVAVWARNGKRYLVTLYGGKQVKLHLAKSPWRHQVMFVLKEQKKKKKKKSPVYFLSSILYTFHLLSRFNPWMSKKTCLLNRENSWFSSINFHLLNCSLPTSTKFISWWTWKYCTHSMAIYVKIQCNITRSMNHHIQRVSLTALLLNCFW